MRKRMGHALVVALIGIAAAVSGEAAANASGGIGETMAFHATMPTEPYAPSPTYTTGPYNCTLLYHEYYATPGCGGFEVDVTLSNVRDQPGYIAGTPDNTQFHAYADTARTFGCRRANGSIDWSTAFVRRTTRSELTPVYATAQASYLIYELQTGSGNVGPSFYVNFNPVSFTCPARETKAQINLKVTNLSISIAASPVFGTHTWSYAGPFKG